MTASTSAKTNLILDLTIFSAFLAAANPRLTGNSIHEWLSVAFTAAIITHLLFHWQWIIKVGGEFFKKLFHQSRLNFVINMLFFVAMTGAIFSGILISKDVLGLLGIQLNAGQGWKMIHTQTSDASLIILGVHVAMHWKWILSNLGRVFVTPISSLFRRNIQPGSLASQSVRIQEQK